MGLGAASAAHAQVVTGAGGAPVQVTADSVEFDQKLGVFTASGNVRVEQPGMLLTADWMAFHQGTRHALASGHVVVTDAKDTLYADFLQFNLDTLQGVAYDGTLHASTGFHLDGAEVRKTGPQTYEFKKTVFTTCECPKGTERRPWTIHSRDADLKVGGYAVTRNTTIDILGIPVLWTPGAVIPVKSQRQTGFLFPVFSNSSIRGTEVGVPFFWAAHDQVGITVTPYWSSKRGTYFTAEGEYVIGPEGSRDFGKLGLLMVPLDQEVDSNPVNNPLNTLRWGFTLKHQQRDTLPWGLSAKADVNMASDNNVPFDYDLLGEYRRNRFMESSLSLTKAWGNYGSMGAFAGVRWADDLQAPEDQDRDKFLLHRLPDVGATQSASPLPFADRLLSSFDVRYTNFWHQESPLKSRPGGVPVNGMFLDTGIDALPDGMEYNSQGLLVRADGSIVQPDGTVVTKAQLIAQAQAGLPPGQTLTAAQLAQIDQLTNPDAHGDDYPPGPEGDGVFQEGEPLLDTGHRLILNPRLALPFRLFDAVEVYPELGYHGTFYQTKNIGSAERSMVTGRLDLRMRLHRTLDVPWIGAVDHLVEPRLTFYGVGNLTGDSKNPLFVPTPFVPQVRLRQLEVDNVLRDPSDRIPSQNGVILGVSQRFYSWENEPDQEDVETGLGQSSKEGWVASRMLADVDTSLEYRTSDGKFGWFLVDGEVYPADSVRLGLDMGWDLASFEMAEAQIDATYRTAAGHQIGIHYRYVRDIPRFFEDFKRAFAPDQRFDQFQSGFTHVNQLDLLTRVQVTPQISVYFSFRYSFEQSLTLTNLVGGQYLSKCKCWALQVSAADSRDRGFNFRANIRVLGLGDDRTRQNNNQNQFY